MLPIYYISICDGIFSPSEGFLFLKGLAEAPLPGKVSALAERAGRAESQFFAGKIDDVPFKKRKPERYLYGQIFSNFFIRRM